VRNDCLQGKKHSAAYSAQQRSAGIHLESSLARALLPPSAASCSSTHNNRAPPVRTFASALRAAVRSNEISAIGLRTRALGIS